MANQKNIPTQADLESLRSKIIAERLKASELNETLDEEQHKAAAAETALNEADRVVRDCLQNSLTAHKKVNNVLSQTVSVFKEVERLRKKEKEMMELMKGDSSKE